MTDTVSAPSSKSSSSGFLKVGGSGATGPKCRRRREIAPFRAARCGANGASRGTPIGGDAVGTLHQLLNGEGGIGSLGSFYPLHSVERSLVDERGPGSSIIVEVEDAFSTNVGGSVFAVRIEIIKLETNALLWCQTKLFEVFKLSVCKHGCAIRQYPWEIYIHGPFHIVILAGIPSGRRRHPRHILFCFSQEVFSRRKPACRLVAAVTAGIISSHRLTTYSK